MGVVWTVTKVVAVLTQPALLTTRTVKLYTPAANPVTSVLGSVPLSSVPASPIKM